MWDVVAEIVKLCTYPAPRNPFAIDFDYFNMLPLSEQVLATAAMVNLLQKILIHTPDQKVYAGQGQYIDCSDMSLVVRKPVFGVSDLDRHEPGCIATEDG